VSIFVTVWTVSLNTKRTSQSPGLSTCLNLPMANLYFTNTQEERVWFLLCIPTSPHMTTNRSEVENVKTFLSSEIAPVYQIGEQFSTHYFLIFWTHLRRCQITSAMHNIIDTNHRIYCNCPPTSDSNFLRKLAHRSISSKITGELKELSFRVSK
jgi:hypothetical protein